MSGFYNNWIKVTHPNMKNDIVQMESGGYQKPFYFGGSQVPIILKEEHHKLDDRGTKRKISFMPDTNDNVYLHGQGIHMPKVIGSLKSHM
jgi:hypothetical protein